MARAQRDRRVLGQPVPGYVHVGRRVQAAVEPPARGDRGQVQDARGDVDIGDLLRHGLESGQRPAELLAGLHVRGRELQRARDRSVGGVGDL